MNRVTQHSPENAPPPDLDDDLPPRLSVSDAGRAKALERVASYKQKMEEDAARLLKPRGEPGRDGNRMILAAEQASDANVATHTVRNVANDPVEWLFNRGSLSQRQYEGANRLRQDAERGSIGGARAVDLSGAGGGGGAPGDLTIGQAEALRRYSRCMEKLGDIGAALVRAVALECRPLKDVGMRMGMDKNYRAPRLAEALDTVADFYRL